jgi:hypothetical protein
MLNIPTRKYSAVTRPNAPRLRNQRGQGILEYILILVVVLGIVFVLAKPVIEKLKKSFEVGLQKGVFKEDPTGANFYYFPLK